MTRPLRKPPPMALNSNFVTANASSADARFRRLSGWPRRLHTT